MKKLILFSLIILSSSCLFLSCGDTSSPPPPPSDTEQPLTPGTAYLRFSYAPIGATSKDWTDSISVCLKNDSMVAIYKGSGSDSVGVLIFKPAATGNFTLGCQSIIYLKAAGIPGSTCGVGGSGTLVVTYFNSTNKTLKATFTDVTLVSFPPLPSPVWTITNGTLKCTWP